jgi:hypothetical protein
MQKAMGAWFLGLAFMLLNMLRELIKSYTAESLMKTTAVGKLTPQQIGKKLDRLTANRRIIHMWILRTLGDLIPAANGSEIPYRVLGKQFSEKWASVGGLLSSFIACHQYW